MQPFEPETFPPEIDYRKLLPLIGKANRAVATLEGTYYGLLNPDVLLSPIATQEAVLSPLLNKLKRAKILQVRSKGSGSRPQVLAFTGLLKLCGDGGVL